MRRQTQRKLQDHGLRHITPSGRSVFADLFPKGEAEELEIRSVLFVRLERWLAAHDAAPAESAKTLGISRACIADIRRGKFNRFSLALLVRLAARAGLRPRIELTA